VDSGNQVKLLIVQGTGKEILQFFFDEIFTDLSQVPQVVDILIFWMNITGIFVQFWVNILQIFSLSDPPCDPAVFRV